MKKINISVATGLNISRKLSESKFKILKFKGEVVSSLVKVAVLANLESVLDSVQAILSSAIFNLTEEEVSDQEENLNDEDSISE